MRVVITKQHCKNTVFSNIFDCPLFRAIKEQHPDFNLYLVGVRTIRELREPEIIEYPFNLGDWNPFIYNDLRKRKIKKVVLDIDTPEYDVLQEVKKIILSPIKELQYEPA